MLIPIVLNLLADTSTRLYKEDIPALKCWTHWSRELRILTRCSVQSVQVESRSYISWPSSLVSWALWASCASRQPYSTALNIAMNVNGVAMTTLLDMACSTKLWSNSTAGPISSSLNRYQLSLNGSVCFVQQAEENLRYFFPRLRSPMQKKHWPYLLDSLRF